MPKFQRQATHANESDILHLIDQRFEDLEETVSLAALVPQLHDRLFEVEQIVKRLQEEPPNRGPRWSVSDSKPPAPLAPPDDDDVEGQKALVPRLSLPKGEETPVPPEREEIPTGLSPRSMAAHSPVKRERRKTITQVSRDKMSDINERLLDTQTSEYYTFGESTWDLVIFIGTGALGPLGSLQTVLLALVNVLMQIVFVAIAYYNFTVPDIDSKAVLEADRWRRSSGHSFWTYSDEAKQSLAERVCNLDKSLEQSGIQVALFENIDKYLKSGREGLEGWFTGQILCVVALICWYLMVAKEVSHATALHRGVIAMPLGPTRLDARENPFTQQKHYRLRSVAARRKLFSLILLIYRLVAAGLLVFVGTFFLVYTVSVTELILNAVALGIILDIDDLLFDALATTPGRHLVHQLDPLPMPSLPRWRGADLKSASMSVLIPTLTLVVYLTMLGPFVGTLTEVSEAMCGGNKLFVWNVDKRQVVLMSPTAGNGWEEEEGSIKGLAVEEGKSIGYGLAENDTRWGLWVSDVSFLDDASVLTLAETIDANNPTCGDLADAEPMLSYLRYFLGNESVQGCADALSFCSSFTSMPDFGVDGGKGWGARMLCSATCGCNDPAGQHIAVQGCPYGVSRPCQQSQAFQAVRRNSACSEKSAASLREFLPWVEWVNTIRAYGESPADLALKDDALLIAEAMWDHGCDFPANLSARNISWGNCFNWNSTFEWDFKTIEAFCPLTCGCSASHTLTSCPQPFGYSCDEIDRRGCLTWNDQTFCPNFSPSFRGAVFRGKEDVSF
ncbi:Uncharacterized protein SCF082_LOCUS27166 [Durusdinium trenchii]|uniref:Uncharacterized protein n=1 Tax=Durusdinium trenchii TaxID=1381693 RepID=A0ABP0MBM5_9DINO